MSHPVHHADTLPALVLQRYRLVRRLGSGGFGTVWLAHDERLDRPVAVKRIPTADAEQAERARREAMAAARLGHPGIVALYESGTDDAACYLVSELVVGETLGVLEAEGALSDRDVVEIGLALCDALAHAHARGVVHRDVKPGNVIVPESPEDGGAAAKLTDFGIARVVGDDALTRTGDVLGTLAYMAPEQAEGRGVSAASDLYALGLVLYEALAGVNPIRGASPAETARRIGSPVPPLRRTRRDLPRTLCAGIDTAVAVDPARRGSMSALRSALSASRDAVDDEPGVVEGGPVTELTRRFVREREPVPQRPPRAWPELEDLGHDREAEASAPPRGLGLAMRTGAGVGAGLLAGLALAKLAPGTPPVAPAAAGAAVAFAIALLPRLAWMTACAALLVWLVAAGRAGTAALLVPALALVPVLLPRAGLLWSLPAAGPVLGLAGLGPAACALTGQASTWPRRAGLGALSALWLVAAEPLLGRRLLAGAPDVPAGWPEHLSKTLNDVLPALVTTQLLALAGVFAVASAVLPWLVRGRRLAPDAVAATAWAAGLAAATQAAVAPAHARGAVIAAVVAGVLALVVRAGGGGPSA